MSVGDVCLGATGGRYTWKVVDIQIVAQPRLYWNLQLLYLYLACRSPGTSGSPPVQCGLAELAPSGRSLCEFKPRLYHCSDRGGYRVGEGDRISVARSERPSRSRTGRRARKARKSRSSYSIG